MPAMAHSPSRSLDVGSVIAETYTIEGMIGRGGMGAVFVASHARLPGKKVAIKVLHPDVADPESLARFRREAEIASRLGHPNIVEVHDWNQLPDGTPYLVLELLHGESLAERLRRGPMSIDELVPLVRQVGSALSAAHREGIVHRDLKPANIYLVPGDDDTVRAKVLDFGISKIRGSTTVKTQDTQMLGTPAYMAPEQALGRHDDVDGRTDVFALGAVVFEMIAGRVAFGGSTIPEVVFKVVYEPAPSLTEVAPGTPPHVAAAVDRALAKKPSERWPDVATFIEALTGAPLVTGRRPVPGAPRVSGPTTASKPAASTREDAFAATVGSGDHADAIASDVRDALRTARERPPATAAPTQAPPPPPPRRRTGLLVGGGALLVAGAAAATFLAMGGGGAKSPPAPGPVAATVIDAGPVADAAPVAVVDDAAAPTPDDAAAPVAIADAALAAEDAAAAPVDARATPRPVDARPAPRPVDAAEGPDPGSGSGDEPPELQQILAEARDALQSGDPDLAIQLSRRVTNKAPGHQAALAIRAQAYCLQNDLSTARTTLNGIRRPALRGAVKRACKKAGIEL